MWTEFLDPDHEVMGDAAGDLTDPDVDPMGREGDPVEADRPNDDDTVVGVDPPAEADTTEE